MVPAVETNRLLHHIQVCSKPQPARDTFHPKVREHRRTIGASRAVGNLAFCPKMPMEGIKPFFGLCLVLGLAFNTVSQVSRVVAQEANATQLDKDKTSVSHLPPAQTLMERFDVRADVVYGHKHGMALTYDVIQPKTDASGVGLMFMVSGGWVSRWSEPADAVNLFRPLLEAGYTVLPVRHGSSPKYIIPEIAGDIRLALNHIHEHSAGLGIDAQRLGVFGFSAGGHLSLLLGTQTNHRGDDSEPRIAAVVAVFPPTDLGPYVLETSPYREQFPALKFDPSDAEKFSPLMHVTADDAPTLLVHGDKDELVPIWHSQKIAEAFQESEVPHKLVTIEGAAHGFDDAGNQRMFKEMLNWFETHLSP